jgi:hypothetical protein
MHSGVKRGWRRWGRFADHSPGFPWNAIVHGFDSVFKISKRKQRFNFPSPSQLTPASFNADV